jgi:hypothetical protein
MLFAGTENGLYVTFDDGAHWDPLQTNLPHAPVSWVTVQPHFHDLVVATYGRGFWILDDISPLEQVDAAALAGRGHLFAPAPAYRFRTTQGITAAPNSAVRGDNAEGGAALTYYLSAALADTASGEPDTTHRRTTIRLLVLDAGGDTVRVLTPTRKVGLNRVSWDLRMAAPAVPRLRTPPPGARWVRTGADGTRPLVTWDLDLSMRGPLVPPGAYTVRLVVSDSAQNQALVVLRDPNTAASDSDLVAQVRLGRTIRDEQDSVARMINRLEWVRAQLGALAAQLRGDSALAGDSIAKRMATRADSLDHSATVVEGTLFDVHLTGSREDAFRHPMQLWGRLAALQSDVSENSADFAPTSQQAAVNELFRTRLAEASTRFADLMGKELPAFAAALRRTPLKDVIATGIDAGASSPSPER